MSTRNTRKVDTPRGNMRRLRIRKGVTIDRPVESIDLVPTLGSLLGFDPRFAQGKALTEIA